MTDKVINKTATKEKPLITDMLQSMCLYVNDNSEGSQISKLLTPQHNWCMTLVFSNFVVGSQNLV